MYLHFRKITLRNWVSSWYTLENAYKWDKGCWGEELNLRDWLTGEMHSEEFHSLCSWPSVISEVNLSVEWAEHVERIRYKRNTNFLVAKREANGPLGRRGVYGRIILKWIIKKRNGRLWTVLIFIRIGASCGLELRDPYNWKCGRGFFFVWISRIFKSSSRLRCYIWSWFV
jgi:hypothetical protein